MLEAGMWSWSFQSTMTPELRTKIFRLLRRPLLTLPPDNSDFCALICSTYFDSDSGIRLCFQKYCISSKCVQSKFKVQETWLFLQL